MGLGAVILGFVPLLSGCVQPQRRVMISSDPLDKPISAYSTPADLRLTFVRAPGVENLYFCAEPMPDVSLGSTTDISGSAKGSMSNDATLSSSYASTLKELYEVAERENHALRRELEKALEEYKKETGKDLGTSVESSLDITSSSGNKSSGNLELQAAVKLAATVSELQGRSQNVLLAREFLYRICEARANGFFQGGQAYIDMQQNALRMIVEISRSSQKSAQETRLDLLKQGIELQKARVGICGDVKKSCLAVADTKDPAAAKKDAQTACEVDFGKCLKAAEFSEGAAAATVAKGNQGTAGGTPVELIAESATILLRALAEPDGSAPAGPPPATTPPATTPPATTPPATP